jgi:hypothetical protein
MKKIGITILSITLLLLFGQSCKKETTQVVDFSSYTATDKECRIIGLPDTTQWINSILTRQTDTLQLVFGDNIVITDSITGTVRVSPPCPDSSNGFFIWNVDASRQCKLKLVVVNTDYDVLYYNSYGLNGGPITLGFDFRTQTSFKTNTSYRMFYGFYNSLDSCYYSGHGDIRIVR